MAEKEKVTDDNEEVESDANDVKSTAIVQYIPAHPVARYREVQINTNLNNPPSNWSHGSSNWESYIQNLSYCHEPSPFSSFNMANHYLNLAGEIDVVSDSENIKKLLKLPYGNSGLSMMVHRVGNTLMLDEFDIHRYLLRQQDNDWKWLRHFFYDTVLQGMGESARGQCVVPRRTSQERSQNRNMLTKFLYYSNADNGPLGDDIESDIAPSVSADDESSCLMSEFPNVEKDSSLESDVDTLRASFPVASAVKSQRKSNVSVDYQRTAVWTFENIQMLIGTDLPIFGGSTHPCVSVRLCDMNKPINVLTGIDYWLDNLICNVPELAMYYHDNGIVQSYELVKTDEIPNLEDSKFSPTVIRDVAQNILSFLKSSATKEGHTYWLFKGPDDDIVKLYDLTTLCSNPMEESSTNPFTVPVGILLYRVARNMLLQSRKKLNVVRALLDNCLTLLDHNNYTQLVTSAHYLLSDVYTNDDLDELETSSERSTDDSDDQTERASSVADDEHGENIHEDCDSELSSQLFESLTKAVSGEEVSLEQLGVPEVTPTAPSCDAVALVPSMESGQTCVPVMALCQHEQLPNSKPQDKSSQYPPITGTSEELCIDSMKHIVEGLQHTLRQPLLKQGGSPSHTRVEEKQAKCDPNVAIPLHYHSLLETNASQADRKPTEGASVSPSDVHLPTSSSKSGLSPWILSQLDGGSGTYSSASSTSWCLQLKALFIRKAAIICYKLAKAKCHAGKLGTALALVREALYCFAAMRRTMPVNAGDSSRLLLSIICLCGDVHRSLGHCSEQNFQQHLVDVRERPVETVEMMDLIIDPEISSEYEYLCELARGEECLQRSVEAYTVAVKLSKKNQTSLEYWIKRLGNSMNELGIYYMNKAAALITQSTSSWSHVEELCTKCLKHFSDGIEIFSSIGDSINVAMLYSNKGKVMRLCAQGIAACSNQPEFKKREFTSSEKTYFQQAIDNYLLALEMVESFPIDAMTNSLRMSISWDLSTVHFTMATLLQDYAPISSHAQQKIEADVVELMTKALKFCEVGLDSTETHYHLMVQYRVATINHRLASLYHNAVRNESNAERCKQCRVKAELHYETAFKHFDSCGLEALRVQLERVALCEYQLSNQTSPINRVKTLERALEFLLDCRAPLTVLLTQLQDENVSSAVGNSTSSSSDAASLHSEAVKIMSIVETRLRTTLRDLIKNLSVPSKNSQKDAAAVSHYKALYALSLQSAAQSSAQPSTNTEICQQLCDVLKQIANQRQTLVQSPPTIATVSDGTSCP